MTLNRREFVVAMGAFTLASRSALANLPGLPLAIQLYSVRQQMAEDFDKTLAVIASLGFTEVEAAALPKKSAKEIRASFDKAGLHCVSAHHGFDEFEKHIDEVIEFDTALGVKYIICSTPGVKPSSSPGQQAAALDNWRFNADRFNEFGDRAAQHGLRFGYHNHVHEFEVVDGITPYDELLKRTDPKKVTFELDCGWARVAGYDPVALMKKYLYRFSMLHVKDFHLGAGQNGPEKKPPVTELGLGNIDYRPILAEAKKSQHVQHAFVEQEAFDMPWQESLKTDAEYMRTVG
jgi:sugar phosphate isomerase/epimerase